MSVESKDGKVDVRKAEDDDEHLELKVSCSDGVKPRPHDVDVGGAIFIDDG
ncbi:MAG: hypothetical protein ACOC1F_00770 [Myxococcota bacterium]